MILSIRNRGSALSAMALRRTTGRHSSLAVALGSGQCLRGGHRIKGAAQTLVSKSSSWMSSSSLSEQDDREQSAKTGAGSCYGASFSSMGFRRGSRMDMDPCFDPRTSNSAMVANRSTNLALARQLGQQSFSPGSSGRVLLTEQAAAHPGQPSSRRLQQQLQLVPRQHSWNPTLSSSSSFLNHNCAVAALYHLAAVAIGGSPQYQQVVFFSTKNATASSTAAEQQDVVIPTFVRKRMYLSTQSGSSTNRRNVLGTTKIPTPLAAVPPEDPSTLEKVKQLSKSPKRILDLLVSFSKAGIYFFFRLPGNVFFYITHPDDFRQALASIKKTAQEEIHHYWVGFKLFWAEIQTAKNLMSRTLQGTPLTRRERKQLLRTISDLFRMVPFSMFVIIPFMEFALPFALRLFPNMLPSTFQDSLKAEENMKRELQSRIAMAQFFQETLEELAKEQKRKAAKRKTELAEGGDGTSTTSTSSDDNDGNSEIREQEHSAASMLEFLAKARNGEMIPPDVIIRYANYFHDDLTLDNMPRMQLINMCKYMSIPPYGSDAFMRFQLRHKVRMLKEDDQRILWEGIDSLTKMELREACQERGMRSTGLSKEAYKQSLQQWLDLSVNKNVPIALLIMSRIFFLRDEMFEPLKAEEGGSKSLFGLADAISGLDKEVLDQVILEVATPKEKKSDPDIRKLKLEVVSKQNELIRQEQAAREAKVKRKEAVDEAAAAPVASPAVETMQMKPEHVDTFPSTSTSKETATMQTMEAKATVATPEEQPRDRDLSTAEMDAISQLVSDDPLSKERAELERIKAAIRTEKVSEGKSSAEPELKTSEFHDAAFPGELSFQPAAGDKIDFASPTGVGTVDHNVIKDSESSGLKTAEEKHAESEKAEEDPVVAGLKRRVESMVDKIEVQMSRVQIKIGDKLHFLDKDRDGVLTREEMADVLQQVLKRKITFDEAMEIAGEMDENQDGTFTVREMIRWMDKNKLVKAAEEGRDVDMDRIMESQAPEAAKDDVSSSSKTEETATTTTDKLHI